MSLFKAVVRASRGGTSTKIGRRTAKPRYKKSNNSPSLRRTVRRGKLF